MNWLFAHIVAHVNVIRAGDLVMLGVLFAKDVLIAFSIASVAVMIERIVTLRRIARIEDTEYQSLKGLLNSGQVQAVTAFVAAGQAPSAAALEAGLDLKGANPNLVHEAITQEIEVESARLRHNLSLLATTASTAPYVGLFGTVLGILAAFDNIAKTGQTGASVVAAPIAEALITTALGLGVAIPAVMAYNYFSGRVNDLSLRVETHTLDLAARLAGVEKTTARRERSHEGEADAR